MLQFVATLAIGLLHASQEAETIQEELPDGGVVAREVLVNAAGEAINHGAYARTSASGVVVEEGEYSKGHRDGRWKWRYDDNKPRATGKYNRGRRTDKWTFFYPGNDKRAQGEYDRGEVRGEWNYWREDGSLIEEESGPYELDTQAYPDGSVRAVGMLVDGAPTGRWRYWWPDGTVQLDADYVRGSRAGTWRFTHADGTPDPGFLSGVYGKPSACASIEEELRLLEGRAEESAPGIQAQEAAAALAEESDGDPGIMLLEATELVEELRTLDLRTADGWSGGEKIQKELTKRCSGRSFGWGNGTDPTENRALARSAAGPILLQP